MPTAPKLVLVLRTSYLRCECVQRGSEAVAATSPGLIFCGTSVEPRKVSVNNAERCGPRTQYLGCPHRQTAQDDLAPGRCGMVCMEISS